MNLLKKTIGFMAVFSIVPVAYALTARPSVVGTAISRMPTMTAYVSSSTGTTATTSSLLENSECIDAYTECLKGSDACGSNFEECTNNTLFFSRKAVCSGTLAMCNASGINYLFGTSSQTALATKNSSGEYTYPTAGSVLGQLISAAEISNRYDTSDCVKKYTSCLQKSDVCGSDFELCTSDTEFKKQKLFCESTLARCQSDGIKELFGTTNTSANPTADSRVGILISEGRALAAVNAVSTCYKVIDQCFLNACASNPYRCKEGSATALADAADKMQEKSASDNGGATTTTKSSVKDFLSSECMDTIGTNQYCYATLIGNGDMPSASQLQDPDNHTDMFSAAYEKRMNASLSVKIDDLIVQFDEEAKKRCSETISSCAMLACGEGSGAACYASAFNNSNTVKGVTNPSTLETIKSECEAVVNNDIACQYAGAKLDATEGDTITVNIFNNGNSLFDRLFTSADNGGDPVGVVASLNARLASSYSQGALDQMKKQCQQVATNCVKSMCGTDYQNCYRNRTDIYSSLTNTGNDSFDSSMNKVGGVLDHTIVLGLCLNTVKANSFCEEHIKAEMARAQAGNASSASSWGSGITNARDGWLDAGNYGITAEVQDIDADGNLLCTTADNGNGTAGRCDDASGMYIYPKMVSQTTYAENLAERQVFRDLIADLEMEAQAKYNAKLTKQQNMCMSSNSGGIIGNKDMGSTFLWVKLKNNKMPDNYVVSGLQTKDFVASNDLYGSFCRIRINIQSDDKFIQDAIRDGVNWATAYYAAGDVFTCGSWIPSSVLEEISANVGSVARADAKEAQPKIAGWMTALGVLGGGVGGGFFGDAVATGDIFGGLTGLQSNKKSDSSSKTAEDYADNCETLADSAIEMMANDDDYIDVDRYVDAAITAAKKAKVPDDSTDKVERALKEYNSARKAYDKAVKDETNDEGDKEAEADEKQQKLYDALETLQTDCDVFSSNYDEDEDEAKRRTTGTVIGSVVGAAAIGGLAYAATKSIQDAQLDKAEREAIDEWMNEVGKHIQCYIGSEQVGVYGDVISTSM